MAPPSAIHQAGSLSIEIVEGDITAAAADAICNAANNHLWMGSGVAGAIKRNGGEVIEREAVAQGPVPVGAAVATTAGSLPHKYVIHGAVMGQNLCTTSQLIAETTRNCLSLADELCLDSVALPAFGTGVGGFALDKCAEVMLGAVARFAESRPANLKRVLFVLFGDAAHRTFVEVAAHLLPA